jgi:hypothetical protein
MAIVFGSFFYLFRALRLSRASGLMLIPLVWIYVDVSLTRKTPMKPHFSAFLPSRSAHCPCRPAPSLPALFFSAASQTPESLLGQFTVHGRATKRRTRRCFHAQDHRRPWTAAFA